MIAVCPAMVYGQPQTRELQLQYNNFVQVTANLIAIDENGKSESLGSVNIKVKYILDKKRGEILQLGISPIWTSGKESNCLWLFDKGGTVENIINRFPSRPERKGYFSNLSSRINPFFEVRENPECLSFETPFVKTGALSINDELNAPFEFRLNSKSIPDVGFDLTLNFYSGKRKLLDKKIQPVKISVILPADFNCREYNAKLKSLYNPEYSYNFLAEKVSKVKKAEINSLILKIDKAILTSDKLSDLKNIIDSDPRRLKCREFGVLSDSIGNILMANEPDKLVMLKMTLTDRDNEGNTDSLTKLQPITRLTGEKKPGVIKQEKIQPREKKTEIAEKKGPQKETCEEYIKKADQEIRKVFNTYDVENFRAKIADLKVRIDSLAVLTADKSHISDLERTELKNGALEVQKRNIWIGLRLDKYDEDFARLESMLNSRKECASAESRSAIDNLKSPAALIRKEWKAINASIHQIVSDISPDSRQMMKDIQATFRPAYSAVLQDYNYLKSSLSIFRNKFESKIYSGYYYTWNKDGFLSSIDAYNNEYNAISRKLDSINLAADEAFKSRLGGMLANWSGDTTEVYIASIKQVRNEVNNQVGQLKTEISGSVTDRFPWALLTISVLVVLTLLFGALVYYRAMVRKRNRIPAEFNTTNQASTDRRFNHPSNHPPNHNPAETFKEPEIIADGEPDTVVERIPESQKVGGIKITRTVPQGSKGTKVREAGRGLKHVYDKAGIDFYELDLDGIWSDTLVSKVYISRACIRKTYKFFFESCIAEGRIPETGGYLIGAWDVDRRNPEKYNVSLEDFIEPGDDAIYEEYQLNFGAKIGVRLERVIQDYREKSGREYTLTAWFHSHPEIKIFLSNHDLDVQERLSSNEHKHKLLALVIDPNTQEDNKIAFFTGIFSYKSNGTMNNNSGGIQMVKWKDLYDWAINPVVPEMKDHYCIDLSSIFNKSAISRLYLNDKSITRFSLFLDELAVNQGATGYFPGEILGNGAAGTRSVVFTDFVEGLYENHSGIAGLFFNSDDPDKIIADLLSGPHKPEETEILIFCNNLKKQLTILTRKDSLSFNLKEDAKKNISFSEIETWPTRRR